MQSRDQKNTAEHEARRAFGQKAPSDHSAQGRADERGAGIDRQFGRHRLPRGQGAGEAGQRIAQDEQRRQRGGMAERRPG